MKTRNTEEFTPMDPKEEEAWRLEVNKLRWEAKHRYFDEWKMPTERQSREMDAWDIYEERKKNHENKEQKMNNNNEEHDLQSEFEEANNEELSYEEEQEALGYRLSDLDEAPPPASVQKTRKWNEKKLGAFWLRKTRAGEEYLNGSVVIDGSEIAVKIFKNQDFKAGTRRPHWRAYKTEDDV